MASSNKNLHITLDELVLCQDFGLIKQRFFAIRIASRSHLEIDNHNDCGSLLCYKMFRYIRTLAGTLLRNSEYDGASNILS